jgi:hypothetical protein
MNKQHKPVMIAVSPEEYQRDQKLKLECSVLLEGARKEAREVRAENERLETIISIVMPTVSEALEMFECLYNSDEAFAIPERMQWYITLSRYMFERTGRKHIADQVEERLNQLPF